MTREELLALRRGDVVVWKRDGELGMVLMSRSDGVEIRWADGRLNFYTATAIDKLDKFVQAPPEPPKPRIVKIGEREFDVVNYRVTECRGGPPDFELAVLRIIELEDELALLSPQR